MSASSARQSKNQVKARRRGPNTKAGCSTCKIRRKRCDQTRPACLRCSTTGRSCDFLSSGLSVNGTALQNDSETSYWSRKITSAPSLLQLSDPIEVNHFDYFLSECTKEFSSFFKAVLWQQLIVQAAYSEAFILHAVLAISSLRRVQVHQNTSLSGLETSSVAEYTTRKYTTALQILRQRLQYKTVDWRLAALASLVFLAIEVLQGHEQEAIIHVRSGEAILKSLGPCNSIAPSTLGSSRSSFAQAKSSHDTISDDIITAFTRLSVEEELFIGASSPNSTTLPTLPSNFEDISAARTALNSIMAATYSFFRQNGNEFLKTLPFAPLPTSILEEFSHIQNTLQSWHNIFNHSSPPRTSDIHQDIIINILLVYFHITSIRLSTYFHYSEIIYDQYTPQFQTIIDLSSQIITHQSSSTLQNSHGPCYTLDLAMAQPLFFTARKCRNLALRLKAIEEMKKVGSKGIYTGRNVAKVAEWVVGVEQGLGLVGFVREERRLGDVRFEFDCERVVAIVTARRRLPDGNFEVLMAELGLS